MNQSCLVTSLTNYSCSTVLIASAAKFIEQHRPIWPAGNKCMIKSMEQYPIIIHLPSTGDLVSLCCSSISDFSSQPSGEEKKKKVLGRRYSRLAFIVQKATRDDSDLASVTSLDSSLSSHGLSFSKENVVYFREKFISSGGKKKKKNKFFERKKCDNKIAHAEPGSRYPVSLRDKDQKTKVSQMKYSRLAFSVQQVGSVLKKKK